ncbi:MAG: MotA/TolQ/ExbB proton channel family protein [Terrimicrobiaceae bacterium]
MKRFFRFSVFLASVSPLCAQEDLLPVAEPDPVMTLWQVVTSGGVIMIPLAILSVIAVALIIIYFFTLSRRSIVTARYMQTADALLRKSDYLGLLAISNRHNEAVARVLQRSLDFLTKNPKATLAEVREIAQTEGVRQASAMNRQISYLADIGSIAPMLGLLGTVLGMIKSFSVVANDMAATRPMMLADGVAQALVTTAAGLVIGIPAMAAYAFFRGRVQSLVSELETATTQLLAQVDANFPSSREP